MATFTELVAFYHIPKTGGIFVTEVMKQMLGDRVSVLGNKGPEPLGLFNPHDTPASLPCEERFSFCFVRHPVEWYRSRWAHAMHGGWQPNIDIGVYCGSDDFDVFVNKCLDRYPQGLVSTIYKKFSRVDYIGKYETLRKDLIKALRWGGEIFDEKVILGHLPANVSLQKNKQKAVYKKGALARLKKVESYAFERFEYV